MKLKVKLPFLIAGIILIIAGFLLGKFLLDKSKLISLPLAKLPGYDSLLEDTDSDLLAPGVLKHIEDVLLQDVEIKIPAADGSESIIEVEDLLLSWRKLPSFELGDEEEDILISSEFLARDQIYLGQALLEMGKSRQYKNWKKNFEKAFLDPESGFCFYSLEKRADGYYKRVGGDWTVSQDYLRLLVFDYLLKADLAKLNQIRELSALLLPLYKMGPPANLKGLGPDLNHPLFSNAAELPVKEGQEEIDLVSVESVDLWLLTQLAALDQDWAEISSDWQEKISASVSDLAMPFPPEGWNINEDTAMPLIASDYLAESWRFLKSSLHLAELGLENEDLYGFIYEELNSGGIAASYHFISGEAGSRPIDPSLSARAGRLARAIDDPLLFAAAVKQMRRSYLADQSSLFFGSFAVSAEDGRLTSYAIDQLLILLALN